jgi:hypothetical protein
MPDNASRAHSAEWTNVSVCLSDPGKPTLVPVAPREFFTHCVGAAEAFLLYSPTVIGQLKVVCLLVTSVADPAGA